MKQLGKRIEIAAFVIAILSTAVYYELIDWGRQLVLLIRNSFASNSRLGLRRFKCTTESETAR